MTTSEITTNELPDDIVSRILSVGRVEWGTSHRQSDEDHVNDLRDTLKLTRDHFEMGDRETVIHHLFLYDSNTVLASCGNSPNSPQHARILAGAWNQLVDLAETQARSKAISAAEEAER